MAVGSIGIENLNYNMTGATVSERWPKLALTHANSMKKVDRKQRQ